MHRFEQPITGPISEVDYRLRLVRNGSVAIDYFNSSYAEQLEEHRLNLIRLSNMVEAEHTLHLSHLKVLDEVIHSVDTFWASAQLSNQALGANRKDLLIRHNLEAHHLPDLYAKAWSSFHQLVELKAQIAAGNLSSLLNYEFALWQKLLEDTPYLRLYQNILNAAKLASNYPQLIYIYSQLHVYKVSKTVHTSKK